MSLSGMNLSSTTPSNTTPSNTTPATTHSRPAVSATPTLAATVAELRGVSKNYGAVRALDDVSLAIHAGEVVALLGPNGAGKTTAVSLLLGLLRPTAGTVRLFGENPKEAANRVKVGAMLQISGVPETLKVKEHLDLFRSYYPNPLGAADVLELAGLAEVADRPYGKLSGGQQQRLHLALALCGNPDLVFLDEPTTGLDVGSRRALWETIRGFVQGGRTVVLTTHYLEEADALADRVVVVDHGRIIAEGTPSAIKAQTAGRKIRAVTRLSAAFVENLPGVTSVRRDGAAFEILAVEAESVVLELLTNDPSLSGLEVVSAGLEDAFLALTAETSATKEKAATEEKLVS